MKLKNLKHNNKKDKSSKKLEKKILYEDITPEEQRQIEIEMSWGFGMLFPGYLPYGFGCFY